MRPSTHTHTHTWSSHRSTASRQQATHATSELAYYTTIGNTPVLFKARQPSTNNYKYVRTNGSNSHARACLDTKYLMFRTAAAVTPQVMYFHRSRIIISPYRFHFPSHAAAVLPTHPHWGLAQRDDRWELSIMDAKTCFGSVVRQA